jgi:hypothetical protein
MELPQRESGVRKELQAELADHSVKASVSERQCLTIGGYRLKRRVVQPTARTFDHRQGDVRTDYSARNANDRESPQCGLACSGGDIENAAS